MIGRRVLGVLVAAACALAASGCSSTLSDAATITFGKGRDQRTAHISRADLESDVSALVSNAGFRKLLSPNLQIGDADTTTDARLTAAWLDRLIHQEAIDAEFAGQHLSVTPAQTSAATAGFQQSFGSAYGSFPKSLRDSLTNGIARFDAVVQSCASGRVFEHVLARTEADAEAARAEIGRGVPFATVAQKRSIDTATSAAGGVFGCVGPGSLATVPELYKIGTEAPLGVVSQPVKSRLGYSIVLVQRWDPSLAGNQQIAQRLQESANAAVDARVAGAHVWVDPRYGTWGLYDDAQGGGKIWSVKAPEPPSPRTKRDS